MSKYDWSGVPKDVMFLVTDSDKTVTGWTKEPKSKQLSGSFDRCDWATTNMGFIQTKPYSGYWRDSLEKRPGEYDEP